MSMTDVDKKKLKDTSKLLVDNLEMSPELLAVLRQHDILLNPEIEKILSDPIPLKFLISLEKKGPKAFGVFIKALVEAGQGYLADALDKELAEQNGYQSESNIADHEDSLANDMNKYDQRGRTSLMAAARNGDSGMVDDLLNRGADINKISQDIDERFIKGLWWEQAGWTALMYAIDGKHEGLIDDLLEKGADVNVRDKSGRDCLMLACVRGDVDTVKSLLLKNKDLVKNHDNDGGTAAHLVCTRKAGRTTEAVSNILEVLCQNGVDLNCADNRFRTPLYLAISWDNPPLIKRLCELGVTITDTDKNAVNAKIKKMQKRARGRDSAYIELWTAELKKLENYTIERNTRQETLPV